MRTAFHRFCALVLVVFVALNTVPVTAQKPAEGKKAQPVEQQAAIKQAIGKNEADLALIPALASDRSDAYVSDLRKEEFVITEDGVKQPIAFFADVKEPFHIVLLIDSGLSLNPEDLRRVKMAAREFLEQLRGSDRVSVISFNDSVKEGCDFTGDHNALRNAINSIPASGGTKVYDAMAYALGSLKRAKAKRSAIILLTDGVDWRSDSATFESSIQEVEESGALVFPIRYDNRSQVETMLRKQRVTDFDAVFGVNGIGRAGSTTVAVDTRVPTQQSGQSGQADQQPSWKLPTPNGRPPAGRAPNPDNRPSDGRDLPLPGEPGGQPDMRRPPDPRDYPDNTRSESKQPDVPSAAKTPKTAGRLPTGDISTTLDKAYNTADQYLKTMAETTGGELHRTEKIPDLPDIFQRISSDLRHQYLLGYYSTNAVRDGKYRKIKVQTSRKDVVIRSRSGYRASK
ncbi:MAG: VWA domain-containing protein [Blastocatellia bacterium]